MANNGKVDKRFKSGLVEATVWTNKNKTKDGEEFEQKSVTLQRSYKDKEDKWQNTNSMQPQDMPRVLLVLQKAHEHILNLKTKDE